MRYLLPLALTLLASLACAQGGLVAAFDFNEPGGTGVIDGSPFGHNGRLWHADRVPGLRGEALAFTRPDAVVRIPRRRQLNLGDAITLEAWIKPGPPDANSHIIIAKNDEYLLRLDKQPEGGHISFFVHVGSPAVAWEPRVSSKAPPTAGVWHHVVGTWDGAMLRLYLDGELQQEQARTGKPNPNPYPVMIGNFEYPSCHGTAFGGLIDEVRIYNRAMSGEEVRERGRS